ncbi:MAG: phosphoribosylanthranilate isomerase [Lachnospiraceae bacterium]
MNILENVKIKMCGLTSLADIEAVNVLLPDYIGFVFAAASRRYITFEAASALKTRLDPGIRAVGVFVDEVPETVAELLRQGTIDLAQLHGHEDEAYIKKLRGLTKNPLIRAFRVTSPEDIHLANASSADFVLLDSGAGSGRTFAWELLRDIRRPYFLAGGLAPENVGEAIKTCRPFAVDVSSGIETEGRKDPDKMKAFSDAVRKN